MISQILEYKNIIKADTILTAIDVETTGLDNFYHKIIELACVKYKNGKEIDKLSLLLDPERDIPEDATKINGITNDMVAGKPKFAEIADSFISFINGAVIVAHNARFDLGFINGALVRADKPGLDSRYVDTLDMARKAFPGRVSYSLQNLAADFNIAVTAAHRAEDDSRVCMELFYRCDRIFNPGGQISLF